MSSHDHRNDARNDAGHDDRRIDDLVAAAALGELTVEEAAELEAAAAADPRLRAELDADAEVVAALQRPAAVEPPPRLREAVLSAVAATPQEQADDDVVAAPTPLRRRSRWVAPLLAAAAVVAIAVGAVVVVTAMEGGDDPVEAVVDASDVVVTPLEGSLGGTVTSYASPTADAVVLLGTGVPKPGPTETYQAWAIRGDEATSLGLFRPDDDGVVEVRFDDVADVPTIGITLEPAGGSPQPTPPVLASG